MLAGDLGATCLERSLNGQGDADWGWRPLDFARGDSCIERLHYLLGTCKRSSQEGLLSGECHRLRTELSHHRNHHSGQQS